MAGSLIPANILSVKQRGSYIKGFWLSCALRDLLKSWEKRPPRQYPADYDDFFAIRAVTYLEVFTRTWLTDFVDKGSPYLENSLPLGRNLKFDVQLVSEVQGRAITLGDILGHSISVNSVGQIVSNLETCLGQSLIPFLSSTLQRGPSPYAPPPEITLIDAPSVLSHLTRLFEVRHILVHEAPRRRVYELEELGRWLKAAKHFSEVASHHFTYLLYGTLPVTTLDMVHDASEEIAKLRVELNSILDKLKDDEERGQLLTRSQTDWETFVESQSLLRADNARGGTMSNILFVQEKLELYKARVEKLRWFLSMEEGEL